MGCRAVRDRVRRLPVRGGVRVYRMEVRRVLKLTIIIWFISAAAFLCVLTQAEPRCSSCMTKIGEDEELCSRCAAKRKIWRVR